MNSWFSFLACPTRPIISFSSSFTFYFAPLPTTLVSAIIRVYCCLRKLHDKVLIPLTLRWKVLCGRESRRSQLSSQRDVYMELQSILLQLLWPLQTRKFKKITLQRHKKCLLAREGSGIIISPLLLWSTTARICHQPKKKTHGKLHTHLKRNVFWSLVKNTNFSPFHIVPSLAIVLLVSK